MSEVTDSDRRDLRLQRINQKGLEVATKLAEFKAGQDITLSEMGTSGFDVAALTKEERIRAYLDLVNDARTRLMSGDFGRCLACDAELVPAALDEMPWTQRCADCERDEAPVRPR